MARSWTTLLLLLSSSEALRRKSNRSESDLFPRRRRSAWKGPGFDSNGCIGPACSSLDRTEFDFIVVGSGAGGGAVAARLAEAGHQVLVLEAGVDSGGEYEYRVPVMHATSTETAGIAWNYYVEHYANASRARQDQKHSSKGILYPRGGALGGSTAVNALITVLPKVNDWERIVDLTNDRGWSPSSMNKFESKLTEWLPMENPSLTDLLQILNPELSLSAIGRLVSFFDAAFTEMGESVPGGSNIISKIQAYSSYLSKNVNDKLRQGNVEGTYMFPQMIRKGNRHGSRERLVEALATGKLTIKTQALVNRVVFSNAKSGGGCNGLCRATEVVYHNGRGLYGAEINPSSSGTPGESRVRVRRFGEIILSAGAFNTPQLLKQSGVGPKDELERFNIPVHVDLPGVGENLQDRYEVTVESQVFDKRNNPLDFISPADCNFQASPVDSCFMNWEKGEGLYATNGALIAMLKKTGLTEDSDLHIFGLPGPFRGYAPGYSAQIPKFSTRNHFSWVILKGHTDNRGGTVKLRCAKKSGGKCVVDPRSQPDINFHYFDEGREYDELDPSMSSSKGGRDLEGVVRAVEFVRKINKRTDESLGSTKNIETWPGDNFASGERFSSEREKVKEWVKREAWGHHASCTAPMGCLPRTESAPNNWKAGFCKADNSNLNPNTVLSSRFTVRGTEGLRVADASAFPRIPGTFLLLPTFMLGEKAAATILEDYDR